MLLPDESRRPFTKEAIECLTEGVRGCFALFNDEGCVYVGKGNLRDRLLGHLKGGYTEEAHRIKAAAPTYFLFEETEEFITRHMGLVVEYQPLCR